VTGRAAVEQAAPEPAAAELAAAELAAAELAAAVLARLTGAGQTLAVAESLTGGLVAAALASVPGASAAFRGGVVAYATDLKAALLGVDAGPESQHDARERHHARLRRGGGRGIDDGCGERRCGEARDGEHEKHNAAGRHGTPPSESTPSVGLPRAASQVTGRYMRRRGA